MTVRLEVDPDRANLSGVTNYDVAVSSTAALTGLPVGTYRELDKQIPIVVRLRMEDRAAVSEVQNTHVLEQQQPAGSAQPGVERRHRDGGPEDQAAQPVPHGDRVGIPDSGLLPSQVLTPLMPKIRSSSPTCPPVLSRIRGEARSR